MKNGRRGFFGKMIGLVATPIVAQALPAVAAPVVQRKVYRGNGITTDFTKVNEAAGWLGEAQPGTAGQVLVSQGAGKQPIWVDPE